jgi:hypothetical protein
MPPGFSAALTSVRGSGSGWTIALGRPPRGAWTIAINISSDTPLYFISANTDGNVSKAQEEVLIFSMMSAAGSFARTIVMMSAFFSVSKPS